MPPLVYFFVCLCIAIVGMNRKFGFWGYLFGSLLLTPVIGFLLVISSDVRKEKKIEENSDKKASAKKSKDKNLTHDDVGKIS